MASQAQILGLFLIATAVIGAVAYYAIDVNGLDPLGLFASSEGSGEVQEAALEALVSALDRKGPQKGGDTRYQKNNGVGVKKDANALYEEMVLGDLVTDRLKRQQRAKQHARETVAAVVEEMTLVKEEETKKDKEADEDDESPTGTGFRKEPASVNVTSSEDSNA